MGVLAVLFSLMAWLCMAMGFVIILGVLPQTLLAVLPALHYKLIWQFWFGISALLFLASIAANMGKRRGGGDEY